MFLLNSRLVLFTSTTLVSSLLPKLRGHFAEFLNKGSPVRLRILSSPTCVGLRYGHRILTVSTFSRQPGFTCFSTKLRSPSGFCSTRYVLNYTAAYTLGPALPSTGSCYPSVSVLHCIRWYWNLHQLSIAYDFCPRLRPRLTLGG